MASYTVTSAKTATLTGTTADTITLALGWTSNAYLLVVVNQDASTPLYFTWKVGGNVDTAVSEADDAIPVLTQSSTAVRLPKTEATIKVSVVGNGNKYSVCLLPTVGLE